METMLQKIDLTQPIADPLTIQLNEKEDIPFRIIVKSERGELALDSYQRPITINDELIFKCINPRNYGALKRQIGEYNSLLKRELDNHNQQNKLDQFEATCKIFLGTQYLGAQDQKRKLKYEIIEELNAQQGDAQQQIKNNDNSQQSHLSTKRNQGTSLVQQEQQQKAALKNKHILVCGVYQNEKQEEINEFINSYSNQNVDLIILVNGLESLNSKLKQTLLTLQDNQQNGTRKILIQKEIKQNKYSVNTALILQYSTTIDQSKLIQRLKPNDSTPRVIFIIKYIKTTEFELLKWIYGGIGKYFDPDYFWVTRCLYMAKVNSVETQMKLLNNRKLCGVTCQVFKQNQTSCNPFNFSNSFLLNQLITQIENTPINQLFTISMEHNPFFCMYKWQEAKKLLDQYLIKISLFEKDFDQNIIVQDSNCILPFIAADNELLFGKSEEIVAQTQFTTSLSKMMEEQRKINNANFYSQYYFWKQYQFGNQKLQINIFFNCIQTVILFIRCICKQLDNYFGVSAIIFLISQSSFQFFGGGVQFENDKYIQIIIPAIFLFIFVIFSLFSQLFNGSYQLATQKHKQDIIINGNFIFYIIQDRKTTKINVDLDDSSKIEQGEKELQQKEIQFSAQYIHKELIISLKYKKDQYVINKDYAAQIAKCLKSFEEKQQNNQNQQGGNNIYQSQQIKKEQKEAFIQVYCKKVQFQYHTTVADAAMKFQVFFYTLALLNICIIGLFILNIIFNFFLYMDTIYTIFLCVSFLLIILQKILLILINIQNLSNFIKGYLSYLFYYIIVTFGMKFYEMSNLDRNNENQRIEQFYYDKIQITGVWLVYNIAFLFICFMIEAYYDFCGYVLLSFLTYYAIVSVFEIIGLLISKACFKTSQKQFNCQSEESEEQISNYTIDDFNISENPKYEQNFLTIQQDACQEYYDMLMQQTKYVQQQQQEQQYQSKQFFTQCFKSIKINLQQQQLEDSVIRNKQIMKNLPPIQENKNSDIDYDGMLQSNNNLQNVNQMEGINNKQSQ